MYIRKIKGQRTAAVSRALEKCLQIHLFCLLQQKLIALLYRINLIGIAVDQIRIDNIFQVIISILQCTCGLVEVILKKRIVFILCIFLL